MPSFLEAYPVINDICLISITIGFLAIAFHNARIIKLYRRKLLIPTVVIPGLGLIGFIYKVQLLELVQNPPSWSALLAFFLYYLTVITNTLKEKVDLFKLEGEKNQKLGEKLKSGQDDIDSKIKKLEPKLAKVNKMTRTLVKARKSLDEQIVQIGIDFREMTTDFNTRLSIVEDDVHSIKADVSGLKADVSGLKEDVSGIKADVLVIKELLQQLLSNSSSPSS
jgi:hypothetical protein